MKTSQQRHTLARKLTIGVGLFCLATSAALVGADTSSGGAPVVSLGCEATAAPVVISNVDCAMGVARAFDIDLSNGLAPWCDGQTSLQVYGCSDGTTNSEANAVAITKRDRNRQDERIDEALALFAANNVETQRCLALTNPGPACIP